MEEQEEIVSAWWYVLGGLTLGFAAGLLAAPHLMEGETPDQEEEQSLISKISEKIPMRIKVAGALGAVKGAGKETYREAKQKLLRNKEGYWAILKQTFSEGSADQVTRLGASLAYYTAFSLAPLVLIMVAVVGLFFGADAAQSMVVHQLQGFFGPAKTKALQDMIQNAHRPALGSLVGIIGFISLLYGASSVVGELQSSLSAINGVETSKLGFMATLKGRAVTDLLFVIGNFVLGLYLGKGGPTSAYGAAGSILALLLWTYYCAQIVYYGAEFTQVYTYGRGSGVTVPHLS